jgi:hypothetical protein
LAVFLGIALLPVLGALVGWSLARRRSLGTIAILRAALRTSAEQMREAAALRHEKRFLEAAHKDLSEKLAARKRSGSGLRF